MNDRSRRDVKKDICGAPLDGMMFKPVCALLLIVSLAAGCGIHRAPDPAGNGASAGKAVKKEQK